MHGHSSDVVGIAFDALSVPLRLWSASMDKTVRLWDIASRTCERIYRVPSHCTPASFALSSDGRLFAIGCEKNKHNDALVLIYASDYEEEPAIILEDCHSDDVVHIAATSTSASRPLFVTASTDGLCNIIDIEKCKAWIIMDTSSSIQLGSDGNGNEDIIDNGDEPIKSVDDVVVQTINPDHSVKRAGFIPQGDDIYLYSLTHDETLSFWRVSNINVEAAAEDDNNTETEDLVCCFLNAREQLKDAGFEADYLIDCFHDNELKRLYLAAGTDNGDVMIAHVSDVGTTN